MKRIIACICLAAILLCMTGCQREPAYTGENIGTTCANITMGGGTFAYSNGFVYFTDGHYVFEYDMESGETVYLESETKVWIKGLFTSEDHIFYSGGGVHYLTKDGKQHGTLFARADGCNQFFADGNEAYYLDYILGTLYHRDMETGAEQALIAGVNSYYVDDTTVYAVAEKEGATDGLCYLFVSDRDEVAFEQIELNRNPIIVAAGSEGIFLSQRSTYQVFRYKDGVETELPIYSTFYQLYDGCLLFTDDTESNRGCFPVKSYDLETGEQTVLCENVYDFCILENRYACFKCIDSETGLAYYMLRDMESGETVQMPTGLEEEA